MPSTEELLNKFRKRDLGPAAAPEKPSPQPGAQPSQAEFRRLRRRGAADNDTESAATLEGLFDEKDGLIGLGG